MANRPNSKDAPDRFERLLVLEGDARVLKKVWRVPPPGSTVSDSYCIEPPDLMFNPEVRTSAPSLSQLRGSHCTPTAARRCSAEPVAARVRSVDRLDVASVISRQLPGAGEAGVRKLERASDAEAGAIAHPTEKVGVRVSKLEWAVYEARCPASGVVLAIAVRSE
jgi:hypothetical protein